MTRPVNPHHAVTHTSQMREGAAACGVRTARALDRAGEFVSHQIHIGSVKR